MLGTDCSVILGHSISSSQAENIMSKPKKVIKQLTIVKKVELIKRSENRSVRQLAKEFGVSNQSILQTLAKNAHFFPHFTCKQLHSF